MKRKNLLAILMAGIMLVTIFSVFSVNAKSVSVENSTPITEKNGFIHVAVNYYNGGPAVGINVTIKRLFYNDNKYSNVTDYLGWAYFKDLDVPGIYKVKVQYILKPFFVKLILCSDGPYVLLPVTIYRLNDNALKNCLLSYNPKCLDIISAWWKGF